MSAHDQMLAAEKGEGPEGSECLEAVVEATLAAEVLRATERLASQTSFDGLGPEAAMFELVECSEDSMSFRATNIADVPLIFWGVLALATDASREPDVRYLASVVSDVVRPGESTTFEAEFSQPWSGARCGFTTRTLVAPVDETAADAGLVPVDPADPQTSDDPLVWFDALTTKSNQADPGDFATSIAQIEDIHSPDLFVAMEEGLVGEDDEAASGSVTYEVCSLADVSDGRDSSGQLVLLSLGRTAATGSDALVGLFRRGSDGLWRYAGRTISVESRSQERPCEGVPKLA